MNAKHAAKVAAHKAYVAEHKSTIQLQRAVEQVQSAMRNYTKKQQEYFGNTPAEWECLATYEAAKQYGVPWETIRNALRM
jgi:tRNA A37 N6-isopentenylltransferase MiaA